LSPSTSAAAVAVAVAAAAAAAAAAQPCSARLMTRLILRLFATRFLFNIHIITIRTRVNTTGSCTQQTAHSVVTLTGFSDVEIMTIMDVFTRTSSDAYSFKLKNFVDAYLSVSTFAT
jgi:hypothetical protein